MNDPLFVDAGKRLPVLNLAGEDIPQRSFAVLAYNASQNAYTVTKPDADSIAPARLVVVTAPIVANGRGYAVLPENGKVWVTHDGTEPDPDDTFGTVEDQWYGSSASTGFRVACASGGRACVSPFSAGVSVQTIFTGNFIETGVSVSGNQHVYTDWYDLDTEFVFRYGQQLIMQRGYAGYSYTDGSVTMLASLDSVFEIDFIIEFGYNDTTVLSFPLLTAANASDGNWGVETFSPFSAFPDWGGLMTTDTIPANQIRGRWYVKSGSGDGCYFYISSSPLPLVFSVVTSDRLLSAYQ